MEQWGDASQVFNGNSGARLPESLEDSGNRWAISRAENAPRHESPCRLE
jgi:hypothetical protein